ncbi:MAG TPA: hypothetical protein VFR84_03360 [Candidatus Angelobacter sp.]|nr:hypothetical protein [Candidatus Angelobacter sp.]
MPGKRMQVREHLTIHQFMPPDRPILVACEKCGNCATLRKFTFPRDKRSVLRMGECSCLHCGHQWSTPAGADFVLRGPLWLRMSCHGNVLWILNREHLDFMEEFIGAELREERMEEVSSRRLSSALPRWMLAAKNRKDVMRCLGKLREKLEATRLS